jgi:hypothetical protein
MNYLNRKFQIVIEAFNVSNIGLKSECSAMVILSIHNLENASYSLEDLSREYESFVSDDNCLLKTNTDRLMSVVFSLTSLYRLSMEGSITTGQVIANLTILIERLVLIKDEYQRIVTLSL